MKKILFWLFCKSFDFLDKRHVLDFLDWNTKYLYKRAIERKRGRAKVSRNFKRVETPYSEGSPFCEKYGVSYDEVHDFDK